MQQRCQELENNCAQLLQRNQELESYVGVYDFVKSFTKDQWEILANRMKNISNETIELVSQYLEFYKFDYITKSHAVYDTKVKIAYRAGHISATDAMLMLLAACKKNPTYKDNVENKVKQKDIEKHA